MNPINREGFPSLNEWDIIVVKYGYTDKIFVAVPQTEGTGLAVKLFCNINISTDIWVLEQRHFREGWAKIGTYQPKKKSWWKIWK